MSEPWDWGSDEVLPQSTVADNTHQGAFPAAAGLFSRLPALFLVGHGYQTTTSELPCGFLHQTRRSSLFIWLVTRQRSRRYMPH